MMRTAPIRTRAAHLASRIEIAAWRDMADAPGERACQRLGLQAAETDGALLLRCPAVDSLLFNRVIGLDDSAAPGAAIDRARSWFRECAIDRFWIHAGDGPDSAALRHELEARDLKPFQRAWVKFLRNVAPMAAAAGSRVCVRKAGASDADAVASIVGPAFDMPQSGGEIFAALIDRPRWHIFAACLNDEPIAFGGLFVADRLGYHAFAATRPEFRGRGAQTSLMACRIDTARRLGCEWIATETGQPLSAGEPNPSFHNMFRCGFEPVALRKNYGPAGMTWLPPEQTARQ